MLMVPTTPGVSNHTRLVVCSHSVFLLKAGVVGSRSATEKSSLYRKETASSCSMAKSYSLQFL